MLVKPKFIGKSATIWGLIMMGLPLLGELVGVEVTEEDVQTGANVADTAIKSVVAAVGFVLGVYGRWKAGRVVQPVTIVPSPQPVTVAVPEKVTK